MNQVAGSAPELLYNHNVFFDGIQTIGKKISGHKKRFTMRRSYLFGLVLASAFLSLVVVGPALGDEGEIRLLVRADDMGVAQSVNEACIKSHKEGIVKSVEVIVPG